MSNRSENTSTTSSYYSGVSYGSNDNTSTTNSYGSEGDGIRFNNVFLLGVKQNNLSFDGLPTLSVKKEYSITGNLIDLQNDNGVKNILQEGSEVFAKIIESTQDIYINELLIEDASIQSFSATGDHIKTAEYTATISSSKESTLSSISLSQNKDSQLEFAGNNVGITDKDLKYLENLNESFSFSSDDSGEVTVNHNISCRFRNRKALIFNKNITDKFYEQEASKSLQKESFLKNKGKGALIIHANNQYSINLTLNEICLRDDGTAGNYMLYFDYLGQKGAQELWQDITITVGNSSDLENSQVSKVVNANAGRYHIEFSSKKIISGEDLPQGETPLQIQGGTGLDSYFNNFKLVKKDELAIEKSRALSSFLLSSSPNYGLLENQYKDTYGLSETFVNFQTNESFDEMTLEYAIQKTTKYGNLDDQQNYSTATNHTINIGEDGIFNVTENCSVRALTTNTESKLKEYVDEAITDSFERCKSAFISYSNAYKIDCDLQEYNDVPNDPITADTFFSSPVGLTKSFNFFQGIANVTITYTNDPKIKSDHVHEYQQALEKTAGVNNITVTGNIKGIGDTISQKNTATVNAFNAAKNNIVSVVQETRDNNGITGNFYLNTSSVNTNKQDGSLSYAYNYTDKRSLSKQSGNTIKRFDISVSNDHPLKTFNQFNINCSPIAQIMGDLFSPLATNITISGSAYKGQSAEDILDEVKNILNQEGLLCGLGLYTNPDITVFLNDESFSQDLNGNTFNYNRQCLDLSEAPKGWGSDDTEELTVTTSNYTTTTYEFDWSSEPTTTTPNVCAELNCDSECGSVCFSLGCCTTTTADPSISTTTTTQQIDLEPNLINLYSLSCADISKSLNEESLSCKSSDSRSLYNANSAWTSQFQFNINRNFFTNKDVELEGQNGIVVFEIKFLSDSDPVKVELFYGNQKVATSSMNSDGNYGPFDANLNTNINEVDQYISTDKGTIPTRKSELQEILAASGYLHNCIESEFEITNGFHQFIWFEFNYLDYIAAGESNTIRFVVSNPGSRNSIEVVNRCDLSKNYQDIGVITTTTEVPSTTTAITTTSTTLFPVTTTTVITTTTVDPATVIPDGVFTHGYFKSIKVPSGSDHTAGSITGSNKIFRGVPCNNNVFGNNENILYFLNSKINYFVINPFLESDQDPTSSCELLPDYAFAAGEISSETMSENSKNTLKVINCEEPDVADAVRYDSIIVEIDDTSASFEDLALTNLADSSDTQTITDFRIQDDTIPEVSKSNYVILTIPQFFTGTAQNLYDSANTKFNIESTLGSPSSVNLYGGLSPTKQFFYTRTASMDSNLIRSDESNVSHPNYENLGQYGNAVVFYGGNHLSNGSSIDLGGFVVFELKYDTSQVESNEFKWLKYQALNQQKAVSTWTKKVGGNTVYYDDQFNPDYQTRPSEIVVDSFLSKPFFVVGNEAQELLNADNFIQCIEDHIFSEDSTENTQTINKIKAHTSSLFNLGSVDAHDYEIVRKDILLNDPRTLSQYYSAPAGKTATIVGVLTCAGTKEFIVDCSSNSANLGPYDYSDYYYDGYPPIPMSEALSSCNAYDSKTNYNSDLNYNYYGVDLYDVCEISNSSIGAIRSVYFKVE